MRNISVKMKMVIALWMKPKKWERRYCVTCVMVKQVISGQILMTETA